MRQRLPRPRCCRWAVAAVCGALLISPTADAHDMRAELDALARQLQARDKAALGAVAASPPAHHGGPPAPNLADAPPSLLWRAVRTAAQMLRSLEPRGSMAVSPGVHGYADGVSFLADKVARALVHHQPFAVAVLGGTCGGGFAAALERKLGPLFKVGGASLAVRSAGGVCGDTAASDVWCVRHLAGDDADLIVAAYPPEQATAAVRESLARWALLMDRAPPLWVVGEQCSDEDPLIQGYATLGYNAFCPHPDARGDERGDEAAAQAVHYLAAAVLSAVEQIQAEADPPARWPAQPRVLRLSLLPEPRHCDPRHCAQEEPPGCRTYNKPVSGRPQTGPDGAQDALNPYRAEAKSPGAGGWEDWEGEQQQGCAAGARCGAVTSASPSTSWLSFSLPRMVAGVIFVCCCCSADCASEQLTAANVEFALDGEPLSPETEGGGLRYWPSARCLLLQDGWKAPPQNAFGHIHLGIRLRAGSPAVRIAQVAAL
eukprot:TRINITY_DN35086_c0_g1_i1.p1 TRINITY_DN35086_c0_g1~~TRINITY_DN35086_c0_g1_i1.p1  ORF type:complete len:509 (+),score=149.58 TRINITY_DN35086_c0_g1_i1:69-1529(+)